MNLLNYQDIVKLVRVKPDAYGNNKKLDSQADVPAIFIQSINFVHFGFQDNIDADSICYVDPEDSFVKSNSNRLEAMYLQAVLFGVDPDEAWYKVESARVNRDHLLENEIDNIQLLLKKTRNPIKGGDVS